jgi:serine/threonine protein kinase
MLGEGAMGQVYRARDVHLDRPVALKLLGARTLGDPSFLERFKREAKLAAQLNHPNIATIYAFGETDREPYIAMELVEGETLAQVLVRGPLPVAQVR